MPELVTEQRQAFSAIHQGSEPSPVLSWLEDFTQVPYPVQVPHAGLCGIGRVIILQGLKEEIFWNNSE